MVRPVTTSTERNASPADGRRDGESRPAVVYDAAFVASPARRLQRDLRLAYAQEAQGRWSARRSLGFILLTNGLFWAGLVYGVRGVLS